MLRKNIFISLGINGAIYFFQFLTTVVVSRLLKPEQVGVFAVSMAVVSILQGLREFGVVSYLVQERSLTDQKVRAVFALALVVGFSLAGLLLGTSSWISKFYGREELQQVLVILSISFLTYPFGLPASAMLRRERRFAKLAIVATSSAFTNFVVTSILCFKGYGPVSLAIGTLTASILHTVIALFFWPEHLRLRPSFSGWRAISLFGARSTIVSLVAKVAYTSPELFVGKLSGLHEAALFTRGRVLTFLVDRFTTAPVQLAAVPELAVQMRDSLDTRKRVYELTQTVCLVNWAILAVLFANADLIISVLYGPQWTAVPALLRIMCFAQGVAVLVAMARVQYEAAGEVERMLKFELIGAAALLVGLAIASQISLLAVCWSLVATSALLASVYWRQLGIKLSLSANEMLKALAQPAVFAIAIFAVQVLLNALWHQLALDTNTLTVLVALAANAVVFAMTFIALLWLTNNRMFGVVRQGLSRLSGQVRK